MDEHSDNPPTSPPGPNPAIGTPHRPRIEPPPTVIHGLGDAHPGEANPAQQADTTAGPTAAELAAREEAEENIARVRGGGEVATDLAAESPAYEDTGENVRPLALQEEGRPNSSGVSEVTPLEYMDSPHSYTSLPGQMQTYDQIDARIDAKVEANANAIERAESVSGLTYREGGYPYEQREFEPTHPERDDVMVGAGAGVSTEVVGDAHPVSAFFGNMAQAQAAVQDLQDIGIAPDAIALVGRDSAAEMAPAGAAEVMPAGEQAVRRVAPELPNDEDLPVTVADQTGDPAAQTTPLRAGLAADEGTVPRVEAPADPEIYSDYVASDADYRTATDTGAAQTGDVPAAEPAPGGLPEITAGRGAVAGGVTGLAVGLAALAIPGIGPILAAGPIVAALTGLVTGAVTGGLLGGLLHAGVPEAAAHAYADRIARGEVLVTVQTDSLTRPAVLQSLVAHGGQDVQD